MPGRHRSAAPLGARLPLESWSTAPCPTAWRTPTGWRCWSAARRPTATQATQRRWPFSCVTYAARTRPFTSNECGEFLNPDFKELAADNPDLKGSKLFTPGEVGSAGDLTETLSHGIGTGADARPYTGLQRGIRI